MWHFISPQHCIYNTAVVQIIFPLNGLQFVEANVANANVA